MRSPDQHARLKQLFLPESEHDPEKRVAVFREHHALKPYNGQARTMLFALVSPIETIDTYAENVMASAETLAKIERIYADGLFINSRLKTTPPNQRAAVARNWLLNDCLELRKIIAGGTTHARGVPVVAILKQSQTLLLAARSLRKAEPTVLQ